MLNDFVAQRHHEILRARKKALTEGRENILDWQDAKKQILEELDDIRAYDQAKATPSERISFERAVCAIRKRD